MRVAIIGSGISGLVCAHLLHRRYDLTVFEANDYVGGHTHTVTCEVDGQTLNVDTGFIVFNDRNYPNFCRLLQQLRVDSRPTSMSFSVRCDRTQLEYNGSSLIGLFAQRRNLLRPSFHRMLRDIFRFNRDAENLLSETGDDATVGQFLTQHGFGEEFARQYLLPMGAAIWSCPTQTFAEFPIRFIVEFYRNHGLLRIRDRPVWRVVEGGSRSYVDRLTASFRERIRLRSPVAAVRRHPDGVTVQPRDAEPETFDEVIFACHSDQALRLLSDADSREQLLLQAFPYGLNTATLHTDSSVLPRRRRAWASWNYRLDASASRLPSVTYNMNILQHLTTQRTVCVTLNDQQRIAEDQIIDTFQYAHPIFTTQRSQAQQQHQQLIRNRRTSFCGAYWGNGFHEAGVTSALAVCQAFDETLDGPSKAAPVSTEGVLT